VALVLSGFALALLCPLALSGIALDYALLLSGLNALSLLLCYAYTQKSPID
jgi:hypothetical protein